MLATNCSAHLAAILSGAEVHLARAPALQLVLGLASLHVPHEDAPVVGCRHQGCTVLGCNKLQAKGP